MTFDVRRIEWVQRWRPADIAPDVTVLIDVDQVDRSWQADADYYVPAGGGGASKYERFGRWLRDNEHPVEMPHVVIERGRIFFDDGRHRFAWCRDNGALSLPVTVRSGLETELNLTFGAKQNTLPSARSCASQSVKTGR